MLFDHVAFLTKVFGLAAAALALVFLSTALFIGLTTTDKLLVVLILLTTFDIFRKENRNVR